MLVVRYSSFILDSHDLVCDGKKSCMQVMVAQRELDDLSMVFPYPKTMTSFLLCMYNYKSSRSVLHVEKYEFISK
jgi:hypothetical protein